MSLLFTCPGLNSEIHLDGIYVFQLCAYASTVVQNKLKPEGSQ